MSGPSRGIVKVCGLTRLEDARHALACGADLLGFVVHPPSPRHVADLPGLLNAPASACGTEQAERAAIRERGVLVTVGEAADPMLALARAAGLRRIQPHVPEARRVEVVGVLKAAGFFVLLPWADRLGQPEADADLHLWEPDPARTGVAGGSGQAHGMEVPPPGPYLLAGGLDGENLLERMQAVPRAALRDLRGFDAASRLEASPGIKDPDNVRAFVARGHALMKG
ncbi:MAG: phosphoribosylanthranilate isomerase [Holophagaceae bacterium]